LNINKIETHITKLKNNTGKAIGADWTAFQAAESRMIVASQARAAV